MIVVAVAHGCLRGCSVGLEILCFAFHPFFDCLTGYMLKDKYRVYWIVADLVSRYDGVYK